MTNRLHHRRFHRQRRGDLHAAGHGLRRGGIGPGVGPVIARRHPTELDVPVVIRGRAPQIQLHRPVQQRLAVQLHLAEQARQPVQTVAEVRPDHVQPAVAALHTNRVSGRFGIQQGQRRPVPGIGIFQRQLVKAEGEARRQQRAGRRKEVGNLQIAAARFRHRQLQRQGPLAVRLRKGQRPQVTGCHGFPVAGQLIGCRRIAMQIGVIQIVMEG